MSISDLLTETETYFKNLWDNILKPDVTAIETVAMAFFQAAATDAAQVLGATGLKIITDAVTAAEGSDGTGEQKLSAAQAQIATDLTTAEIDAPAHIINAAIEAAVAQLNATEDAQAATTAVVTPDTPDVADDAASGAVNTGAAGSALTAAGTDAQGTDQNS